MPGGRLTHDDRRLIAAGLAEGLTYTEIAARLVRPVSTVSREVIRNGGADAYQPELAQDATRNRARRSGPTPSAPAEPSELAVHDLEERFTAMMVATGLPRMTARVLTCLYITDSGSMTAAELVQRLRVSPASVSKAVGDLERQELIRRERDPRGRRDRYVIDADIWMRGWLASARQNTLLAGVARHGAEVLGAATQAGARLAEIGEFFEHIGRAMTSAAEQWQKERSRPPQ